MPETLDSLVPEQERSIRQYASSVAVEIDNLSARGRGYMCAHARRAIGG